MAGVSEKEQVQDLTSSITGRQLTIVQSFAQATVDVQQHQANSAPERFTLEWGEENKSELSPR